MGDWGMKVSQTGLNVTSVSNKDLAFSSAFTSYKIHKTSLGSEAPTITIPHGFGGSVGGNSAVIPHGLTYQPSFQVWATDSNGNWKFWNSTPLAPFSMTAIYYSYTDKTNLFINFANGDTIDHTVSYHYIIMLDAA